MRVKLIFSQLEFTMYLIQNLSTGRVWNTDSAAEARMFALMDNLCAYSVFKQGGSGCAVIPCEIR
jgi:hypothetical protein